MFSKLYLNQWGASITIGVWIIKFLLEFKTKNVFIQMWRVRLVWYHIFWFLSGQIIARKKAKIRNQYNQATHLLTQDTAWESDKNTIKHHIQESQEVSPFPAGDHKAAMNRQENITNTKHKQQKWSTKEAPPWNGQLKYFYSYWRD